MITSERYSLDTNLLFYALDTDAGPKHQIAKLLVAKAKDRNTVILLQTLGELCNAVKKKNPVLIASAQGFALRSLNIFEIASATRSDLQVAIEANQQHGIPFWDAMLWATARRAGCTLFLTEDLQHERTLGGVTFLNPFLLSSGQLELFTT